ncbi:hypothetical protein H0G72_02030 [Liberibacter sp. Z1]|nr:hypothetical protein [Candidatus Liberibacter sp.]
MQTCLNVTNAYLSGHKGSSGGNWAYLGVRGSAGKGVNEILFCSDGGIWFYSNENDHNIINGTDSNLS